MSFYELYFRLQDFYADICRGPRRLPAPQRPPNLQQLTPADPAGLEYLNEITKWLGRTHVEFANGAHADLTERARQLHDEVRRCIGFAGASNTSNLMFLEISYAC
jgi:hypothetical protein